MSDILAEVRRVRELAAQRIDHPSTLAARDAALSLFHSHGAAIEAALVDAAHGRPGYAEIAGAVARGWCSPNNSHKEMDSELAYAITVQVAALLDSARAK